VAKRKRFGLGWILFLLFTVVPLIEIVLVVLLGNLVGFWPTIAMVFVTAGLGAWLGKREGLRVYREWRKALSEMRVPDEGITSGLLVLVGGVLLIAPGVLTDIVGLILLIRPARLWIARRIQAAIQKRIADGQVRVVSYGMEGFGESFFGGAMRGAPNVIDVEGEEVVAPSARPRLQRER
jgi:UPF0716 protein FxsA